jgi:hypothetical protein
MTEPFGEYLVIPGLTDDRGRLLSLQERTEMSAQAEAHRDGVGADAPPSWSEADEFDHRLAEEPVTKFFGPETQVTPLWDSDQVDEIVGEAQLDLAAGYDVMDKRRTTAFVNGFIAALVAVVVGSKLRR